MLELVGLPSSLMPCHPAGHFVLKEAAIEGGIFVEKKETDPAAGK